MNLTRVIVILMSGTASIVFLIVHAFLASAAEPPKPLCPSTKSDSASEGVNVFTSKVFARRDWIEADLDGRALLPWEGNFSDANPFYPRGWIISRKGGYVSNSKLIDMGSIEAQRDRIKLISESPYVTFDNNEKSLELIVVQWGERVYLVEQSDMMRFCNFVNSGHGKQIGKSYSGFYIRVGDSTKEVTGLPRLPAEYEAYLLKEPIKATIQKHELQMSDVFIPGQPVPLSGQIVTLSAGKNSGFRVGMELFHNNNKNSHNGIYIVLLAEKTSLALITGIKSGEENQFTDGTILSTIDLTCQAK